MCREHYNVEGISFKPLEVTCTQTYSTIRVNGHRIGVTSEGSGNYCLGSSH